MKLNRRELLWELIGGDGGHDGFILAEKPGDMTPEQRRARSQGGSKP